MKLSNNEVTLTGFVGGEPKEKQTGNGKKLTRVSLATTEGRKNRDTGEWTNYTTWHNLVGWGKVAESMASLTKGAYVQVRGSIRNYDMPAKGNSPARQVTEIVVTAFSKLDRARRGERVPEGEAA
jgi:single-strand DNA-binding protein